MDKTFDYDNAFSRNIGWVTEKEQQVLRGKRVAIAGLGGVGGSHLLTLTRLGIGAFHISDFDRFDLVNFNRQAGATLSHLGRPKVEVLAEMAQDIDPELDLRRFPEGVSEANVDAFLEDCDLYVDGLDFFAIEARRLVFAACTEKGIPAVTAAPLGMGVSLMNFLPGRTTFEEYMGLEGQPLEEQYLRFLLGLSPMQLQMRALVDDTRLDLEAKRGPSTPMGCELCAGATASQALKILLHRGPVIAAPKALHFDAYGNLFKVTSRPGGANHPLQRLTRRIAHGRLRARLDRPRTEPSPPLETSMDRVLDLARWAPSGDNTQPWRFEVIDGRHCRIHGSDTRDWCVYDLQGRASQIALGALLETLAIAASGEGLRARFARQADSDEAQPCIDMELVEDPQITPDPLRPFIPHRVTQRRPFSTEALTPRDRQRLEAALPEGFRVAWLDTPTEKARMARLLFLNARIRLTIPEAYEVHKRIIQWDARFSEDRIPDQAMGLDAVALRMMRWAMQSWDRVHFLNRWLAGTWMPRIQLDWIPGRRCAAHFMLVANEPPKDIDAWLAGGRALQRFWLTATAVGLQFQPEMTPLIFAGYVAQDIAFTQEAQARRDAERLRRDLSALVGEANLERGVFMGRVGYGPTPRARSLRLPLPRLLVSRP